MTTIDPLHSIPSIHPDPGPAHLEPLEHGPPALDLPLTRTPLALTLEYGPLVVHAARRVAAEMRPPCARADLIALGVAGLLEASRRFDPTRGVRFASFAYHRVRGAIVDGIRALMPLPRRAYQLRVHADDALARGAPLDRAALARLSPAFVMDALDLDAELAPADPDDDTVEGDGAERVTREPELDAEGAVAQRELVARMHVLLEELTGPEQTVVRGMYFEQRSLDDLGAELGISRSWACRIHTRALRRLRRRLDPDGALAAPPEPVAGTRARTGARCGA